MENKYGYGENPPYSLYHDVNGKWGLVDATGNRLPAAFDRLDEYNFSSVPWEIVTFNEKEGFELQSWYDPFDAWFNFTWDDPAYPEEFDRYLWMKSDKELKDYSQILFSRLPSENFWLLKALLQNQEYSNSDNDGYELWIKNLIKSYPEVKDASVTNKMINLIMQDKTIDSDMKCALWQAKVNLDYVIRDYLEEND